MPEVNTPMTFLEKFMKGFAPKNEVNRMYPYIRKGSINGLSFEVIETKNTYWVICKGEKKQFSNAIQAAFWLERLSFKYGYRATKKTDI